MNLDSNYLDLCISPEATTETMIVEMMAQGTLEKWRIIDMGAMKGERGQQVWALTEDGEGRE